MAESTRSDGRGRAAGTVIGYGGWPRHSTWKGFPDPDDDTDGARCGGCGRFVPCRHCPSGTPALTPEQRAAQEAAWDEQEAAWNAHAETERAAGRCEFSGLAVHDCHTSICDCFESWDCACVKESQRCHHCGALPEDDGDHSCPCPRSDSECLEHTLSPVIVPDLPDHGHIPPARTSHQLCLFCGHYPDTGNHDGCEGPRRSSGHE